MAGTSPCRKPASLAATALLRIASHSLRYSGASWSKLPSSRPKTSSRPCHPDALAIGYALKLAGNVTPLANMAPPGCPHQGCCLPPMMAHKDLTYQNLFRILTVQCIDADSFDLLPILTTRLHIAHPEAERLIPFDTFNMFYRDDLEQTRLAALRHERLSEAL